MLEIELNNLVHRLEAIAKANHDEFGYEIKLIMSRGKLCYRFVCYEKAEYNEFITSDAGNTILEVVNNAAAEIPAACEKWSYINPEDVV